MLRRGTDVATAAGMAAVLCLVFLPVVAAIGFMLGSVGGDGSTGSVIGGIAFVLLAGFLFCAAFNLSRGWDEEGDA